MAIVQIEVTTTETVRDMRTETMQIVSLIHRITEKEDMHVQELLVVQRQ